jgi:hypothetical protein
MVPKNPGILLQSKTSRDEQTQGMERPLSRLGDCFPRLQPPCHQFLIGLRCEMLPPAVSKATEQDFPDVNTPQHQVIYRLRALVK